MTSIGSVTVNQGHILPLWFNVGYELEQYLVNEGVASTVTEDDKILRVYSESDFAQRALLEPNIVYSIDDDAPSFTFSTSNNSPLTVSQAGVVEHVSPNASESGTVSITCSIGDSEVTKSETLNLAFFSYSNAAVLADYVTGANTAREALSTVIDGEISSTTETGPTPVYTTRDFETHTYVRNSNCLLANTHTAAFTCASPWNSRGGQFRAGTAVTPRHVLVATHYSLAPNDTIKFVDPNNNVVTRTVTRKTKVGANTDIDMLLLDSDLPATITPCKIFPQNFEDYLPAGSDSYLFAATQIPLITINAQGEQVSLRELSQVTQSFLHGNNYIVHVRIPDTTSPRYPFYEPAIDGDSGSPVFAVIGSELWLMNLWWFARGGTFLGSILTELNSAISSLDASEGISTGYTVTEGDLSSYTDFS